MSRPIVTDEKFRFQTEYFLCPNDDNCGAQIPRDCIISNIDPHNGTRNVRAHCEKCGGMWEANYRLAGATWILDGELKPITDERRRKSFMRRVEHTRGVLQHEALSA